MDKDYLFFKFDYEEEQKVKFKHEPRFPYDESKKKIKPKNKIKYKKLNVEIYFNNMNLDFISHYIRLNYNLDKNKDETEYIKGAIKRFRNKIISIVREGYFKAEFYAMRDTKVKVIVRFEELSNNMFYLFYEDSDYALCFIMIKNKIEFVREVEISSLTLGGYNFQF